MWTSPTSALDGEQVPLGSDRLDWVVAVCGFYPSLLGVYGCNLCTQFIYLAVISIDPGCLGRNMTTQRLSCASFKSRAVRQISFRHVLAC